MWKCSFFVLGLCDRVLVVRVGGLSGKLLEVSSIEPMSATSKVDPSRAKAECISNGGSASRIKYLRRGKKTLTELQPERRGESM